MPKRKRNTAGRRRLFLLIAAIAIVLFAAGEAWFLLYSDAGRLTLGKMGLGNRAHLVRIIGNHAREALAPSGVPRDSIREQVAESGEAAVAWRVGLTEGSAPLQIHHAIAASLESRGASVLSGRERPGPHGETFVRLLLGIGKRPTHDVTLVLPARGAIAGPGETPTGGRVALVLYGFGDGDSLARATFSLQVPFAVAVSPASRASASQFALAHARDREVVLHLPLEPVNYPRINPGPGTILVTMSPSQVAGRVRKFVDQAEPVIAVANQMGSLATQDMSVMTALFRELKREKLPFMHVTPAPGAVCRSLSSSLGVLYEEPDAVIESESRSSDSKALEKRWKALLDLARERGQLVVWMRVTPVSAAWLTKAAEPKRLGGVSLVPLSALLRRPVTL